MADYSLARAYDVTLIRALADRLERHPELDPHAGLCALLQYLQGDELDADERELVSALQDAAIGAAA